jgi:acetyl-CoA C-acetyltransferase
MHISIIGQAISIFGELWDLSLENLMTEVMDKAVAEAQLEPTQIEAIFVANKAGASFENQHHLNALASQHFDHYPPAMRVEAACASGSLAMIAAEQALLAGQYQTVLVVGVEKMTDASAEKTTQILSGATHVLAEQGSTFPALYSLIAQMHMRKFGTTREQLSAVAVKNHAHAMKNTKAQFHKEFTLDQISQSQLVADPLRLLDCSPISDGAAAVVLTTKKVAGAPRVIGFGHGQDSLDLASRNTLTALEATQRAAKQAYTMSQCIPTEVQAAEVHDCFTIAELLAIEDLGLVSTGKSGEMTLTNKTTFGNKVVVNPSGGLKACGHPVGATGVKQIAYLADVMNQGMFTTTLAHNVGGSGSTAIVHILQKET